MPTKAAVPATQTAGGPDPEKYNQKHPGSDHIFFRDGTAIVNNEGAVSAAYVVKEPYTESYKLTSSRMTHIIEREGHRYAISFAACGANSNNKGTFLKGELGFISHWTNAHGSKLPDVRPSTANLERFCQMTPATPEDLKIIVEGGGGVAAHLVPVHLEKHTGKGGEKAAAFKSEVRAVEDVAPQDACYARSTKRQRESDDADDTGASEAARFNLPEKHGKRLQPTSQN